VKILVTGAGGTLGRALCRSLARAHDVAGLTRSQLDVTDAAAVVRCVADVRPAWVAHLAAWTDVDGCEKNPPRAFAVNAAATETLAAACDAAGVGLLLVSSLAVFDGTKTAPYVESDTPHPANVYGASKRRAEEAAAGVRRHLIVRTGWLVEGSAADNKFVGRILRQARGAGIVRAVVDKLGSPTTVDDLSAALVGLVTAEAHGLRHVVNAGGPVSRFKLAQRVVELAGLRAVVQPVRSDEFPGLAPRPEMEAGETEHPEVRLRHWAEALAAALGPHRQ
jgi:dTDP-4-dehydrorhamnose reductase